MPAKSGSHHLAYLWEYGRPGGPVVFDFRVGRGRLQSDDYAAYAKLGEGFTFVAYMAHIGRKFVETAKRSARATPC